jgi:lipase chaperone LimK
VQRIRELRRQAFGADVAQALFGAEEERWFTELELRRVALDPELDPAERARRIEALEAELPPDVREVRGISQAALQLRRDEAALRERGASEAEIHAVRADRFGEEAAHRLAALDAERAQWDERVAAWQTERARILAEDHDDPEAAIDAARRARFDGAELRRIRAVDASVQASAAAASRP